jgi:hypothetical protein
LRFGITGAMENTSWISRNLGLFLVLVPVLVGVITATAGFFKSRGDKAKKGSRGRVKNYLIYFLLVVLAALVSGLGAYFFKRSADLGSAKAAQKQAEMQRKFDVLQVDLRDKIYSVRAQLSAAKKEEAQVILDDKFRLLSEDLDAWARDFVTNLPSAKAEFSSSKAEQARQQTEEKDRELQKQKQNSSVVYPVFAFTIRYLHETVKAYTNVLKASNLAISTFEHPDNYYGKSLEATIAFNSNAVWKITIARSYRKPFTLENNWGPDMPSLTVDFIDSQGKPTGLFAIQISEDKTKIRFYYQTTLPSPQPSTISGTHDFFDHEVAIRSALRRIINAQLLHLQPL